MKSKKDEVGSPAQVVTTETKISIRQPNAVTTARYKFSAMQKNVFYYIIEALQPEIGTKDAPTFSLFGDCEINLPLARIAGSQSNYKLVLTSIKDLMTKPICYFYNDDNKSYEVTTMFIYTMKHQKNSGVVTVKVSAESIPVLLSVANGFTSYNKKIAINLVSVYSKRMYENICRWKDKGGFSMTIDEFRLMLGIEDKFKNNLIGGLRQKVLDVAKEELDIKADYSFNYDLKKAPGSRAFTHLTFKIYKTNQGYSDGALSDEDEKFRKYGQIYNFVVKYLPLAVMPEVADRLKDAIDGMDAIINRFSRFKKDVESGKIQANGKSAYFAKILQSEYGIPIELIPYRRKYKMTKKRAAERTATLNFTNRPAENSGRTSKEANAPQRLSDIMKNLGK